MSLANRCPLCGGGRARPVWHEAGLRYVVCSSCALVRSDLSASAYAARRRNAWDAADLPDHAHRFYGPARAAAHSAVLDRLGPPAGRSLLDVGCGLGFFLERAQAAGWDVSGCDTSPHWVARAGDRVGPDRVRLGEAGPGLLGGRRFDVVTLWDVIEHVQDPVALLRAARGLLAPGGRLFVRTPNFAYVWPVYALRRWAGRPGELGPDNHVVYFTSVTLRRALSAAGLRALAWPVFVPPQVPAGAVATIALKNAWARGADRLAVASCGRVALGSDLDVLAGPA